jgi:hypothetical protein
MAEIGTRPIVLGSCQRRRFVEDALAFLDRFEAS